MRNARQGFLLAGSLLIAANLRVSITSVGPLLTKISDDVNLSSTMTAQLTAIPLIGFALFSPVAPFVSKRYGLERSIVGALTILCAAILLRSLPVSGALWSGTILLGIAIAFLNVLLPPLLKRDFPERIGQVTGLYSATQGAVAALGSGVAVPLASMNAHGWRIALGIWAGLAMIALAAFLPRLRSNSSSTSSIVFVPATLRVPSEGYESPWATLLGWQVTIFMGTQSVMFFTTITWLPSIELDLSISASTAGWHLLIFQLVSVCASLLTSAVLRRISDQRLIALTATLFSAAQFSGLLFLPELIIVWIIFGGLASGSTIVIALAFIGLRTEHQQQAASLSAMAQSVGYFMASMGPMSVGVLYDWIGTWNVSIGLILLLLVVQALAGWGAGANTSISQRHWLHEPQSAD